MEFRGGLGRAAEPEAKEVGRIQTVKPAGNWRNDTELSQVSDSAVAVHWMTRGEIR